MKTSTIGIVGLGLMGSALAERAIGAGLTVVGFDTNDSCRRSLERIGGQSVASLNEVGSMCRRIVFSLPTTAVVESVICGLGQSLRTGTLVIDTTTGDPVRTASLGKRLAAKRVRYVDATVAGSSVQTRAGEVIVLAGGTSSAVGACEGFFSCFARRVFHVGPVGAGARTKLVVNLALGLNRVVLAEALGFARSIGVRPKLALEILKAGPAFSRVMETKGNKMLTGDFSTEAKLSQHLKDVRLILALGKRSGAKLPFSRSHLKLLSKLEKEGFGELDNSVILKAFEDGSS